MFCLLAVIIFGGYAYYIHTPPVADAQLSGEYKQHSIKIDSIDRSYSSYQPKNLKEGAALIIVLHGSGSNGEKIREQAVFEFDLLADTHGFVVVYPDGYDSQWNDCRASADYLANTKNIDELTFFRELIKRSSDQFQISPEKVFVTGHSNGGHMAYRLALETPELIRAIAPISANLPVDNNLDCEKSGKPISVAIFTGTEDPINPFNGGLVSVFGNTSRGSVLSSAETANYWKQLAEIKSEPELISRPEADGVSETSVLEQRWLGPDDIQVRHYTLSGSGHVIPSKMAHFPKILGPSAGDISGPNEIVRFFYELVGEQSGLHNKAAPIKE